jgi:hypothetical protein
MENIQKIIIGLLVVAMIFSVVSTLINFSLLNFEFKPINVQVPSDIKQGNPNGNINLIIEGNPSNGGTG